ncbi:tetratricopeptide repeat protein [Lentzea sp. BCCO 10_0856]|uniref:Tetratricopeptide repeat protein n=1 Tax=Lentzea miocenica TaxID=3095431 RepID=A0ABU4T2P5_9PSEU|nr:tetratricopeptide repeat protein [Lentzea sp. BCCO 10_0856]MDX8032292.1 tetratricopeptide repeat protein [Lentzea sp. BCCO 10_0856]
MGADPGQVATRAELVRELEVLRGNAARGSGRTRVSLADLAKRIEVPRSTVHTYLTGQTLLPAEVLDRIVIALGGTADDQRLWADAWDRVAAHEHSSKPAPLVVRPRQLPADVAAFTGRAAEIGELDGLLVQANRTVLLTGTPGVGKTALAVHWGQRVAAKFPDGQLYLNLRGYDVGAPVSAADAALSLLRGLGVGEVPQSLDERTGLLRSALAGRRVLLVLDNASSAQQVRPLLPASASCFAVVTSRDALTGLAVVDGAHRIDLDVLTSAEGVELLESLLGQRVHYERQAAVELVELCARLPLTVRIAAEFARHEPLKEVVRHLRAEGLDLLDSSGDPRSMVRAVFSWSYRQLRPEAAELFRLLGLHPGRDFDVPLAAALVGTDLADAALRVEQLIGANLLQGNGRYEMHDLLRAYSRELAVTGPATTRLIDHYIDAHTAALALAYPRHFDLAERPEIPWLTDADVARDWLTAEADNVVEVVKLAADTGLGAAARQLAHVAKRHLETTSRGPQAMRMHHIALDTARADGDPAGEGEALRNLGVAAEVMGRPLDSLDWLRQSSEVWLRLGNHRRHANTLSSIGITLDSLGRFDEAIAAHEKSVELLRHLDQPQQLAMGLLNLGVTLEQQGELNRALANQRAALETFRTLGDQLGQAHALTNLGNVLNQLGDHGEALLMFDEALAGYRALGSRIGEAFVVKFRGSVHREKGEHDLAIVQFEDALRICREAGDPSLQAEVLNHLGFAHGLVGDQSSARAAHHEALALATEHGYRLEEARALEGLGTIARSTGAAVSAKRHWQQALERYEAIGVPDAERLRAALAEL